MRYIKEILILSLLALLTIACSDDIITEDKIIEKQWSGDFGSDKMSVKLRADIVERIDNQKKILSIPTGSKELDEYLKDVGANYIRRIFPYAGKDEYKQQQEGLNLWYTIELHKRVETKAGTSDNSKLNKIASYIEPVSTPRLENAQYIFVEQLGMGSPKGKNVFNDPLYIRQWNFHNNGTIGNYVDENGNKEYSSIAGADIDIEPAWGQTTGDPNVIIAVVDGGIDINHPDLQESIWRNEREIPENGIDDDNNGYIDDYYGYNFVDDTCAILGTRHGTHVAGIIAARNNNGIGVCGIAGGDGNSRTGVRLMSCQIFRENPNYDPNDLKSRRDIGTGDLNLDAAAIVYGANNGAVISQNSWGFGPDQRKTPQVIKDAIDYFNKYAGGVKTRKPLMRGGIVIFASGNDGIEQPTYPAAEDNVISVAAWNPDFQASWYTNYGQTIDIAAPGGTQPEKYKYPLEKGFATSAILSTVPGKEKGKGGYAYMQGTSMACPHVAGIAALIVSKYGNDNFTAEDLRQRIITGVKQMNYNDYVSRQYFDGMGWGYVDAFAALTDYDHDIEPLAPEFIEDKKSSGYESVTISWRSANQSSDGSLQGYILYASSSLLTQDNLDKAHKYRINANYAKKNDIFEHTSTLLESNTTYYFAVQAVARNGKRSPAVILNGGVKTLYNDPPKIEADITSNRIVMAGKDVCSIHFTVTDKENHDWTYTFKNAGSISVVREGNRLTASIDADKYIPGIYKIELVVTDEYKAKASSFIILEIVANNIPSLKKSFGSLNIKKGSEKNIKLVEIIDDEHPSSLSYHLIKHGEQVSASIEQGVLSVKGLDWGESYVEFSATDVHKNAGVLRIPIFVYENEGIYALYPTVVKSTLYVKIGDVIEGDFDLIIRNTAGKKVMRTIINTSWLDPVKRTYLFDVQDLTAGNYVLSLMNKGKIYQSKFIKK